ncbi:hypothetical protein PR048_008329 [Dryococelus australis]|uniref:DDE Tnp4 domain-containing protein n=1 Tax=Dryococelus australis TaxID=614101 RepID=A0ABQ9HXQ0_9NEOP|nr:hypothetical protein PR048_008329 [Dryococelus australis]
MFIMFQFPSNEKEWEEVLANFYHRWNFPNCGGTLDGCHIAICKPAHSVSYYYNYKGYFSIVLLTLTNANYEFVMIENTLLCDKLKNNKLKLPDNRNNIGRLNFVFIGDEAFSLGEHVLKPFAMRELNPERKVYNYTSKRYGRKLVRCSGRFRVLHTTGKAESVVKAFCILHNYLRRNCRVTYSPSTLIDGEDIEGGTITAGSWRNDLPTTTLSELHVGHAQISTEKAKHEGKNMYCILMTTAR